MLILFCWHTAGWLAGWPLNLTTDNIVNFLNDGDNMQQRQLRSTNNNISLEIQISIIAVFVRSQCKCIVVVMRESSSQHSGDSRSQLPLQAISHSAQILGGASTQFLYCSAGLFVGWTPPREIWCTIECQKCRQQLQFSQSTEKHRVSQQQRIGELFFFA